MELCIDITTLSFKTTFSRMTSVALRWLSRCARYIEVSPVASTNAAIWLAKQQLNEGGWRAPTPSVRSDPRAQAPLPLAAYALVALLQTKVSTFQTLLRIQSAVPI